MAKQDLPKPVPVDRTGYASENGFTKVKLTQTVLIPEEHKEFWNMIRTSKDDFFNKYKELVEQIFECNTSTNEIPNSLHPKYGGPEDMSNEKEKFIAKNKIPFTSGQIYSLLKYVTEKYIHIKLGAYDEFDGAGKTWLDKSFPIDGTQTYYQLIEEKLADFSSTCSTSLTTIKRPAMIELIWSYWMEQGLLVQSMIALSRRFQNMRTGPKDPLANLTIDPLRPMNNLLWGYVQDTQHRLTIARRAYEYDHHYGLKLIGSAVPTINSADSRSKFIGSFNNLLIQCALLYKQVDDLTINADGFPVLNALREVHLLLAEGAHNQFGDLPTTARIEMLMEQFILSRDEIKDFLSGRTMMPYKEEWMDRIDSMKTLQGWNNTSISYYFDLADYGEKLLLSIRWGNWANVDDSALATQWAVFWRSEIQRYIHSFRTVTGVDLSSQNVSIRSQDQNIQPAILIQRRSQQELQNESVNGEYAQ